MTTYCYDSLATPLGPLLVAADDEGLRVVAFPTSKHPHTIEPTWRHGGRLLDTPMAQLRAYFAGELTRFDLPVAPLGTPFQLTVWQALRAIPYGDTISYGELARRIGNPRASRAVGLANGANPIPIVIPCHRVIGANGTLVGFGGGLDTKARLLSLERRQLSLL
ncbi:MAG: methylated-DNA--[protein]-cysteine S-methyltransferase [Vicinamibacterales bacterium]